MVFTYQLVAMNSFELVTYDLVIRSILIIYLWTYHFSNLSFSCLELWLTVPIFFKFMFLWLLTYQINFIQLQVLVCYFADFNFCSYFILWSDSWLMGKKNVIKEQLRAKYTKQKGQQQKYFWFSANCMSWIEIQNIHYMTHWIRPHLLGTN